MRLHKEQLVDTPRLCHRAKHRDLFQWSKFDAPPLLDKYNSGH